MKYQEVGLVPLGCDNMVTKKINCCEIVDKYLINEYGDALCSGVLGRLYSMTNKAWSDPQMAVIEGQRYEAVVNQVCAQLYSVDGSGKLGSVYDTSDLI